MTTCNTSRFIGVAILCAGSAMFAGSARADGISFSLTSATQKAAAGSTVYFSGTVSTAGNTNTIYFNGDSFNITPSAVLNDDGFFNSFPLTLDPNMSVTSPLFSVMVPLGATGSFSGSFSLLGGAGPANADLLSTRAFEIDVTPAAATTTPEPSSLLLLGTGAVAALGAVRRRLRQA